MPIDWEKAGREVGDYIFEEVEDFITQGPGTESSRMNVRIASARLLRAVKDGNEELQKLAKAQLRASFEVARIEEVDRMEQRLDRFVSVAGRVVMAMIRAGAVALALVVLVGCCGSGGMIKSSEIEPLMLDVLDRYDAYVIEDEALNQPDASITEADLLRSSKILRDVLNAAKNGSQ